MATFVLIHGMFHGGWCWDKVKAGLEADGHKVYAPDLAGCGKDKTPPMEVTLQRWTDDLAALLGGIDGKVVLLGHSRGGLPISQVAEAVPEKIAALVYLTALMLPNGKAAMHMAEIGAEAGIELQMGLIQPRPNADGTALIPNEGADDIFYGDCSAEDRAWAIPQVGHEPMIPLGTPVSLTPERYGSISRIYIETTLDRTLPINNQRAMIAVSKPTEVITFECDHMPNVTHVPELVAALEDIAARYAAPVPA